jgi:hypothetical protein
MRAKVHTSQPDSPSRVRNVCRSEWSTNGGFWLARDHRVSVHGNRGRNVTRRRWQASADSSEGCVLAVGLTLDTTARGLFLTCRCATCEILLRT